MGEAEQWQLDTEQKQLPARFSQMAHLCRIALALLCEYGTLCPQQQKEALWARYHTLNRGAQTWPTGKKVHRFFFERYTKLLAAAEALGISLDDLDLEELDLERSAHDKP